MRRLSFLGVTVIVLSLLLVSSAGAGVGVSAKAGTLGLGVDISYPLMPRINARAGFNVFSFSYSTTQDDVNYDADLTLRSMDLLLDLFPIPGRGFRVSGGLLVNGNGVDLTAEPTGSYTIGSTTYPASQIGTLSGNVDLGNLTPYLGIGWGNAVTDRMGFMLDIGIVFQGSPDVTLSASGPITLLPSFQEDLQQEEQSLEDEIDQYKYYLVLSVGLSFSLPSI